MKSNPQDGELLRSYLLGEIPEREADLLERRLLEDDDLFELCEAIEADLLAACARGELASAERERVLRRLAASPQGRERFAQARALNTVADEQPQTGRAVKPAPVVPFPRRVSVPIYWRTRWAAALAASLLVLVGLFALLQQLRLDGASPHAPRRPQATRITETLRPAETPAPPQAGTPAPREPRPSPGDHLAQNQPEPFKAFLQLSLATLRDAGELQKFTVPAGEGVVEIQVDLEGFEDFKAFQASVRDQGKGTIWKKSGLEPRRLDWGSVLVLDLPAERLPAGRYEVRVQGAAPGGESEELGYQEFEVVRVGKG